MTAPRHRMAAPARLRRGGTSVAVQARQSWSDAGPLLLVVVALTLTVVLADATPRAMTQVADDTVREAVAADPSAGLTVTAPITQGETHAERDPTTADQVTAVAQEIATALPAGLAEVLGPPVGTVRTSELNVAVPGGSAPASMRMAYVWREGASGVEWVEGTAPGQSPGGDLSGDVPWTWAVEVGLSAPVAQALNAEVGERLTVAGPDRLPLDVTVTGVFRARDADDPVWDTVPGMLEPVVRGKGAGLTTTVAAYLSPESLPDARLALGLYSSTVTRSFTFAALPEELDHAGLAPVARLAAGLEAAPQTLEIIGPRPTVTTDLDTVLRDAQDRVRAAGAQASVLLVGVLGACTAVLGLGAWLLVRRRTTVIRGARARGATLAALALGPLAEQLVLALVAGSVGLAVAQVLVPGSVSWAWVAPVVLVTVLAVPLLSTGVVGLTDVRRPVTDRHQRRRSQRVRMVRRVVAEGGLVLLAVVAVLTLRARGIPADPGGADLLLVAAPSLAAVAVGVVGARVARAVERAVRPVAARLRGLAPVLAAARGAAGGGTRVPFVALTLCVGLAGFAVVVTGTLERGQEAGSWDTVGADVVVHTSGAAALDTLADEVAAAPGVEAVAAARLQRTVQVFRVPETGRVDVLAVDAAELVRLWTAASRPVPAGLAELARGAGQDGVLPVLVSASLADQMTGQASLAWADGQVDVTPVGDAPLLPAALVVDGRTETDLVLVDRAALAEAAGVEVPADVLWAVGPGAEQAVAAGWSSGGSEVTGRGAWLAERRAEPLTAGLLLLLRVAVPVLLALGVVVVVLSAAATAPGRATTLAVLRLQGLGRRGVGRIALGELLPWALAATAAGVLVGVATAVTVIGPLELRLVTGQVADPATAWDWWWLAATCAPVLAVGLLVVVEQSARRRERLGQVMRVGG